MKNKIRRVTYQRCYRIISLTVMAMLEREWGHLTQSWKRTIQGVAYQSLVQ